MISEARLLQVLRAPVVSEKSTAAQEQKVLVFKVLKNATKEEIKLAVKTILGVDVVSVRTANYLGKVRRTARGFGKRSDWKKAYVTLPKDTQFDVENASMQINEESK